MYNLGDRVFEQLACYINMDMMQFDYRPLERKDQELYTIAVEDTD